MRVGILLFVTHSTTISAREMFSRMEHLGINPVYYGLMMILLIGLSLEKRREVISLLMIVSIVRGLQSFK